VWSKSRIHVGISDGTWKTMAERIRETDDIRSGVKGRGSEREQSKKKYAEKRNPYHI